MPSDRKFVPCGDGSICPRCGSVLGRFQIDDQDPTGDALCPAPICNDGESLAGVDGSYLYRGRALIFMPDKNLGLQDKPEAEREEEVGVIRAVLPEDVHNPVPRRRSPVVATDVRWPSDRRYFLDLFDRHVHHESAPHVTPLNDGLDATRQLPVL